MLSIITGRRPSKNLVVWGALLTAAALVVGCDKVPLLAPSGSSVTLSTNTPIVQANGSAEILLDDATRIAEKLHAAGVEVRLALWPNMLHVFPLFAPILSEGRDGCLEIGNFIRSRMT